MYATNSEHFYRCVRQNADEVRALDVRNQLRTLPIASWLSPSHSYNREFTEGMFHASFFIITVYNSGDCREG